MSAVWSGEKEPNNLCCEEDQTPPWTYQTGLRLLSCACFACSLWLTTSHGLPEAEPRDPAVAYSPFLSLQHNSLISRGSDGPNRCLGTFGVAWNGHSHSELVFFLNPKWKFWKPQPHIKHSEDFSTQCVGVALFPMSIPNFKLTDFSRFCDLELHF